MRPSVLLLLSVLATGCSTDLRLPGALPDGRVRLPNGWILSPAGRQVEVGELPLSMVATPDEQYVIVNNDGTGRQNLSVIQTASWDVVQDVPVRKSWLGMKWACAGKRLIVSGGNDNRLLVYAFERGRLALEDSIALGAPRPKQLVWVAGLDCDSAGTRALVAGRESDSLYEVDLLSHSVRRRLPLPAKPYTCLLSHDGRKLFVSLWGGSAVGVFDGTSLVPLTFIKVGDHPCDMVQTPDGRRLFVANANENSVSVIDLPTLRVMETITTSLSPSAPEGSTPNAMTVNADGSRLYVANADNNYLAVFDIRSVGESRPLGFIPTGWYPTALLYLSGSHRIVVASGKGLSSRADPDGPNPTIRKKEGEYIGSMFRGTVAVLEEPSDLTSFTAQVVRNSPYSDGRREAPGNDPTNPIPARVGGSSPIKHVFYIIKENRTYDQVFGDIKEGNGDPSLCLFPEEITPNHHALACQFVLLDNFYCDAEVSADGHNWSMGAYATDYVEKSWPTSYGGRGGEYEFEGGYPYAYPSSGFLWDNCSRHGVSYRNYGEFARNPDSSGGETKATMPSLEGHVAPHYRTWDLAYSDVDRARSWIEEFERYEADGLLPQFEVIKLPNDHTEGTRRGSLTPRAFVAQNDLALGMIVERISRSRYWMESAIFVIEDDAQNGPDHVDAHRTVALVISPWTKHAFTDHGLYSTTSMVRTMELILGLPALSQFDAASTPMYASFASRPDPETYTCRPASVDLNERNREGAYGQARSEELDFSAEDRVPDLEFNEILWKSIRGADSPLPPPVRSAFVAKGGD